MASSFPVNRVHDVLRRMEDNAAQAEAMKTCFGILAIMSREETNKLTIARDGIDAILNAMTAHIDKVDVQEVGCDLLWSLAFNHATAKEIIGKQGGVGVLVRSLKRHSRSADFLKSACGALSNLCQSKPNQQAVASQGGLQPLVGAIHVHSANGRLLPFLFDALAALIVGNEDNARSVSSLGGIPLIIAALARHKSIPEVVKSGCHSLAILSDVKGQASKIAFAGGVPTILPILDSHPSYADLHRVAAVVLLRMLQESTHVAREITCHEGIRILLKSLEKGGAQQDTVAAVTHILYTVTNPSAPSSASIEAQLWHPLHPEIVTDTLVVGMCQEGGRGSGGSVSSAVSRNSKGRFTRDAPTDLPNGISGSSSHLSSSSISSVGIPSPIQGIRAYQNGATEGANKPTSPYTGAQSTLVGLIQALGHYRERRDVARAGCRLVTNLLHFVGVAMALDRLYVVDRVCECVSSHPDTRDVLESAAVTIKAIYRKTAPTYSGQTNVSMKGLLAILRTKLTDDEAVMACTDILTKHMNTGHGSCTNLPIMSLRMERERDLKGNEEFRTEEGRTWEMETLYLTNKVLQRLVGLDSQSPDDASNMASAEGSKSVGRRVQWAKTSASVLGSMLSFVEALSASSSLGQDLTMSNDTYYALLAVVDNIPPKHSDLCRRIDKILPLLHPSQNEDTPKGRRHDYQLSASQSTNSISQLVTTSSPCHSNGKQQGHLRLGAQRQGVGDDESNAADAVAENNTNSTRPSISLTSESLVDTPFSITGMHIESKTNGALRGGRSFVKPVGYTKAIAPLASSVSPTKKPLKPNVAEAVSFTRAEIINCLGKQTRRLLPLHPLKIRKQSGQQIEPCKLLDTWPNFLERILVPPHPLSAGSVPYDEQSAIPERMQLCYESVFAAGKELQSRCLTMVPYTVPSEGFLGEPFEHSLTFDSEFESGNLLRAVQRDDACYDLFLRADMHTVGHTQWFYFAVANTHPPALVRLAEQGVQVPPVRVKFNIVNLTKPDSLFNLGMRPVLYSCQDASSKGLGWVRAGSDISYYLNPFLRNNTAGEGTSCFYTLTFTIEFHNPKDTFLIAYTYPYTCEDSRLHINSILERPGASDIIRQGRLCATLGGNDCDLLVITNFKDKVGLGSLGINLTESRDETRRRLSDAGKGQSSSKQPKRCLMLSGRVHPGEPPASWMMKGILDFLTSSTPAAVLLRHAFVIFIVPMLNPDGVMYGNNRCCLAGVDLNRQWKKPVRTLHPNIFYLKNFMKLQKGIREVLMYIDLHGHSRKSNVFMYGCDDKKRGSRPQVRAFPKFFAAHSAGRKYVSFQDCSFHVKKGRESTARVVVAKELNIPLSYTLEATFCGSNYGPLKNSHMNIGHLIEVGSAMCDAILNFFISEGFLKDFAIPGTIPFTSAVCISLSNLRDRDPRELGVDSKAKLMCADDDDDDNAPLANADDTELDADVIENDNDNDNDEIDAESGSEEDQGDAYVATEADLEAETYIDRDLRLPSGRGDTPFAAEALQGSAGSSASSHMLDLVSTSKEPQSARQALKDRINPVDLVPPSGFTALSAGSMYKKRSMGSLGAHETSEVSTSKNFGDGFLSSITTGPRKLSLPRKVAVDDTSLHLHGRSAPTTPSEMCVKSTPTSALIPIRQQVSGSSSRPGLPRVTRGSAL